MEEIRMNIKNNKNCKITINDEEITVSEKEKTADELFKALGFKKVIDNDTEIKYQYINKIMGDGIEHTIKIAKIGKIIFSYQNNSNHQVMGLGEKELQAINKKVRELRLDMMNKCKYIAIRSKNYEKYFYCRLNKKIINYTTECIKCVKNEPRKNKSINKVSKKKITVTQETYDKVMQRDNYKCRLCGTSLNLQLHHIIYRSEDKSKINDINNCIMLCVKHHVLVHSNKKYWQPKLLELVEALQR